MTALERAIAHPRQVRAFAGRSPLHGLDRRSVGFFDVMAQSVAAVAPAAATTTVIALIAGVSPAATVISIAIAAILAFCVAHTITQFARRLAAAGSTYTYTVRGLGIGAGLASGAAIVIGYAAIAMFALLGGAYFIAQIISTLAPPLGGPALVTGVLVAESAYVALVMVRGIRLSSRVALIVEALSVGLIVVLLCVLLVQIGPIDPAVILPTSGLTPAAVAATSLIALTAFVGFESSATLSVESVRPLRTVPRAILWTVFLAAALYLLAAVTQVAGFAALGKTVGGSISPLTEIAGAYGLVGWAIVADVGISASFIACVIGSATALTRILFAMGRDGAIPAPLGRVHPRFGTPITAIAVSIPAVTLVPVALLLSGITIEDAMRLLVAIGGAGYIVAYILVCIATPVFLNRIKELTPPTAILALVSTVALAASLVAFFLVDAAAGSIAIWVVAGLAAAVAVAIAIRLRRGHATLDGLGSYDEPTASAVLGGVVRPEGTDDA